MILIYVDVYTPLVHLTELAGRSVGQYSVYDYCGVVRPREERDRWYSIQLSGGTLDRV